MRFRTQAVAYPYFVVALLLYGLQIAFGLLSAAKYLGPDPIKDWLPFDVSKAIHTNLLIVWVLTGFMGAAYWIPSFWVPALLVTHYITFVYLLKYWKESRWLSSTRSSTT